MKPNIISVFDKCEIITGAHKRHLNLLTELQRRGYRVNLFSPYNLLGNEDNYFKIPPHSDGILPKSLQTVFSVRKSFKKQKSKLSASEVILVFGFNHIYPSIYLKKKLNIPLIFALRSNTFESRRLRFNKKAENGLIKKFYNKIKKYFYLKLFVLAELYVYKFADIIVVQNKEDKKNLNKKYKIIKEKIEVVPNNIIQSKSNQYLNKSVGLKNIIFVGSLSERKGVTLLLESFKELIDEKINIQLKILGLGDLADFSRKFIERNNLTCFIHLCGYVDNVYKHIAEADLLVLPSFSDSFPNAILEALEVGTPAIGSNVGGIAEILSYDFLLFEVGSKEEFKNKIKMLVNPDQYKLCQKFCAKRRKEFIFDWPKKFEDLILKVVANEKE